MVYEYPSQSGCSIYISILVEFYYVNTRQRGEVLACLQAVTGGFIAENPFRSVIERHLGFSMRALPGTSGRRSAKIEGGGGGGKRKTAVFHPSPRPPPLAHAITLSTLYPAQTWPREFKVATSLRIPVFFRPSNRLRAG